MRIHGPVPTDSCLGTFVETLPEVEVVVFDDVAPPRFQHSFWSRDGALRVVVSEKSVKGKLLDRWKHEKCDVAHAELGGVTDWSGSYHVYTLREQGCEREFFAVRPSGVPCRFGDLTDQLQKGGITSAPRGDDLNVARDLLPFEVVLGKEVEVKLQCVFARSRYVRRPLTLQERLSAADLPAYLVKKRGQEDLLRLETALRTPFKTIIFLGQALCRHVRDWPHSGRKGADKRRAREWTAEFQESATKRHKGTQLGVVWYEDTQGGRKGDPRCPTWLDTKERYKYYVPPAVVDLSNVKAVKSDDADVPVYLWNDRLAYLLGQEHLTDFQVGKLAVLRRVVHRYWVRLVRRSWWDWWRAHGESVRVHQPEHYARIREAGVEAVEYAENSSFWKWDAGSGAFFWRWRPEYQLDMAIGVPPMWTGDPPSEMKPPRNITDPEEREKVKEKILTFMDRGYLGPGEVHALLNYFAVAKGDDIRTVFDGTRNGLNDVLWAPWFPLATLDSALRVMGVGYWCGDNDYGEMFYNFWLHPDLQPYCGIDVSDLFPLLAKKEPGGRLLLKWRRPPMGVKPSPHGATMGGRRLKHEMLGQPHDPYNIFGWSHVLLNCPGTPGYRPDEPWISKRRKDGLIAADICDYVDDLRTTAPSSEECWLASSEVGKKCGFYGCQDATRKRRLQSRSPGPWAGGSVKTEGRLRVDVSQDKWDKTKSKILEVREEYDQAMAPHGPKKLNYKLLERTVGFLMHVSEPYPTLKPLLTPFYNTLNSWRPGRDDSGFDKYSLRWQKLDESYDPDGDAPEKVSPTREFEWALEGLELMTNSDVPPARQARPTQSATVSYAGGDASKAGYGRASWSPASQRVRINIGNWTDPMREQSSNLRELETVIANIEDHHERGDLHEGTEIFLITDNATSEACFYKGTAKSRELYRLMLRLHKIQMAGDVFIHVIWVAGTRMIENGIDGLSRADFSNGVMTGESILDHLPIGQSALERSTTAHKLVLDWLPKSENPVWLEPKDWFTIPFEKDGVFIWTPPPCLADVAVELMAEAQQARPWNTHLFMTPNLMTSRWRKKLGKATDEALTLPFHVTHWPGETQHERLTLAIAFPLLRRAPWRVKRTNFFKESRSKVRSLPRDDFAHTRNYLLQLWISARALEAVSGSVPFGMLPSVLSR